MTWSEVTAETGNTGKYLWRIVGPQSSAYRILVRSLTNPAVFDLSSADFVVARRFIKVMGPNGGEVLRQNSTTEIRWLSGYIPGNVRIDWTSDGGRTWQMIARSVSNTGSSPWRPTVRGEACLVRLTSEAVPEMTDTSDASFTVVK